MSVCVADKVSHMYEEQQQIMTRDQRNGNGTMNKERHSPSEIRRWRTRAVALVRSADLGVVVGIENHHP